MRRAAWVVGLIVSVGFGCDGGSSRTDAGSEDTGIPNDSGSACTDICGGCNPNPCPDPVSVVGWGTATPTTISGSTGGNPYDDECPPGQVLIGVAGQVSADGWLSALGGICGTVNVSAITQVTTLVPGEVLPEHGTAGASAFTAVCPVDRALVGFSGRSGWVVDQLVIHCAQLTITGDIVSVGAPAPGIATGGSAGTEFPLHACLGNTLATTIHVQAGAALDGVLLGCEPAFPAYAGRTGAIEDTSIIGGPGGGAWADNCPPGNAIIGYAGVTYTLDTTDLIRELRAQCASVRVVGPLAAPSGVYLVPTTQTTARGTAGGTAWTSMCEPGSAVVGVDGTAFQYMTQLVVECAPLQATARHVVPGTSVFLPEAGGAVGDQLEGARCPSETVAVSAHGRSGEVIDAVGLGCAPVVY